jgi:hypothetical protein
MVYWNTENFPVKEQYYYIIDFRNLFRPVLLPVYFVNKNAAKRALQVNVPKRERRKKYSIMKGVTLKKTPMKYRLREGKLALFTKYQYPDQRETLQQRKTYRTIMRRRLRRMNLLTLIKPKRKITDAVTQVKFKHNNQKVAKSPRSIARAFWLERKGPDKVYLILKKELTKKRGKLFHIKTIEINFKTQEFRKRWIYTQRNDVIVPMILTEIIKKAKGLKNEELIVIQIGESFAKYYKDLHPGK